MKNLPKYFAIKRDESNPLWRKYINWFNNKYGSNWNGDSPAYYGYDNSSRYKSGTMIYDNMDEFENNPVLLTLEEWNDIVNENKETVKESKKMKNLPKYFVIKRDESDPLWQKYIDWLNDTYTMLNVYKWNGDRYKYYGYDGNKEIYYNGTNCYDNICDFENNPVLLTLEEWNNMVNENKESVKESKKIKSLPEYFVVERDDSNPLWQKYADWLNKTYKLSYNYIQDGDVYKYYGYDGNKEIYYNGTNSHDNINNFKNNPVLLTLEEWNDIVNNCKSYTERFFENKSIEFIKNYLKNNNVIIEVFSSEQINEFNKLLNLDNSYYTNYNSIIFQNSHRPSQNIVIKTNDPSFNKYELFNGSYIIDRFKNVNKVHVGYKFKEKYKKFDKQAKEICECDSWMLPDYCFLVGSYAEHKFKEAGILDVWFEPVYEIY